MVKFEIEGEKDEELIVKFGLTKTDDGGIVLTASDGNCESNLLHITPWGTLDRFRGALVKGIDTEDNGCIKLED